MDLFEIVKMDHRAVEKMMSQIQTMTEKDPWRERIQELRTELLVHLTAEELTFYAEMHKISAMQALLEHAERDHGKVRQILEPMQNWQKPFQNLLSEMKHLEETVNDHVTEEEHDVFPSMAQNMSRERLDELRDDFSRAKERLKKEGIR